MPCATVQSDLHIAQPYIIPTIATAAVFTSKANVATLCRKQLMEAEEMIEIPEALSSDWLFTLCPEGQFNSIKQIMRCFYHFSVSLLLFTMLIQVKLQIVY